MRVGITIETLIPHFLEQIYYLVLYFTKTHISGQVSQFFIQKNIVTGKISPIGKMEKKRLFWVGGKAPWRADDSTDLKVGPGSILS